MPTSFPPIIHRHKAVLISLERKEGKGFFAFFQFWKSVGELSPAYVPALFLGSFSAGERTKVVLLLSLHPHLFPVLVGVGVIQLVLLARPTAAAVATVSKSGEGESSRRKGELDVVMWDTGYPAAAADMSEVEMWYVQVHFKEGMVGQKKDSYSVPTSNI